MDFKINIKRSFKRARSDFEQLKNSANEWIMFLKDENSELKTRIVELETRLKFLESAKIYK